MIPPVAESGVDRLIYNDNNFYKKDDSDNSFPGVGRHDYPPQEHPEVCKNFTNSKEEHGS